MSDKPDLSAIFSMLSQAKESGTVQPEELLSSMMNASQTSSSHTVSTTSDSPTNESSSTTAQQESSLPDMEMMMKIMRLMQSSHQDSPSKELLKSLKPFLNDTRKEKVDQYIQLLGISKALEMLQEMGDLPK